MQVKVLLCGMGGYGENYVKEYLRGDVEGSVLVGIADPFATKSPLYQSVVEKGFPIYPSLEEFFSSSSADLTIVSSPIHTHYPYIMEALSYGCDVLTEKPVCFSMDQIGAMIRESEKRGKFVAVGYQLCFSGDVLALKKDILSGMYGACLRMKTLRLMRRDDIYYQRNGWAGKLYSHGEKVLDSPFCNACAHQAQNELFLLGDAMDESAKVEKLEGLFVKVRPDIENYDTAALLMTTDRGVPCYYYTSHAVDSAKVGPLSLFEFEKGLIKEEDHGFVAYDREGNILKDYRQVDKGERMEKLYESVRCVKEHRIPVCTLKAAMEHTRAVLMAQEVGITDLSSHAVKKMDEKESAYYTIEGLQERLVSSYDSWSIPYDMKQLVFSDES